MEKFDNDLGSWISQPVTGEEQCITDLTVISYNVLLDTWDGKTQLFPTED